MNKNADQEWVEREVLQGKDILFYGTLAEDFSTIPPEEFWKEFRTHLEKYLATTAPTFIINSLIKNSMSLSKETSGTAIPLPIVIKAAPTAAMKSSIVRMKKQNSFTTTV